MTRHSGWRRLAGWLVIGALAVWMSPPGPAHSHGDDALAIIDRAIAAHGGAEALAEQRALTVRSKGFTHTTSTENPTQPFTSHSTRLLPDKLRQEIRVGVDRGEDLPGPADYVVVVNGDAAWMRTGGRVYELTGPQLAVWQLEILVMQASSLVPLKEADVKLRSAVDPHQPQADIVVVQFPKKPALRLSFDKTTSLLIKTEYRTTDPAGEPVQQENFYDQFKKVGGVQRFHHYTVRRDGEPFVEGEVLEYTPAKTADEKLFAKPSP